ncbi:unnamed protein product [Knipowitschia caucasica]|uniref:Uncharacterized protein n=1 Tax=Knipowitschia caucasica TaxID=637954 RepID=A0AAV2JYL1_KNICA
MNTRQGGRKTPDEPDDGPGLTTADQQGAQASGPQDKMEEIAGMMKSMMSSQYTRDKMVEKERARQEQRWNAKQDQVQQLQQQLMRMQTEGSAHPEPTSWSVQVEIDARQRTLEAQTNDDEDDDDIPRYPHRPYREPKLLPLGPGDEHFLTRAARWLSG